MKSLRFLSLWLFGAVASFVSPAAAEDSPIKLGLVGVTTGRDANIGAAMLNGSKIAIAEWNAKGGVLGRPVEAVVRDDEGKPDRAVAVAQDLVSQGVVAIIGHFNSGCTIPASETYYENEILQITPGSTNPRVTEQGFETLFRICGRDDQQGVVAGEYAAKKGWNKVAVLHDKTAYGEGLAREFKKTLEAKGGQAVLFTGIPVEETDFRSNISAIKSESPDAVYWGGMYAAAGPFIRQLRQAGIEVPFMSGDGAFDKELINMIGDLDQNIFLTFGVDYRALDSAQPFLKAYREQFGEEGAYSIYGYDAAHVVLTAIQKAGSTQAAKIAEVMKSDSFQTALGELRFDAKGDRSEAGYIVWTVQDGQFVALKE